MGHGRQPARARHRQRALPDRAGQRSPARSASPAPACTRCAARTTCRAPATPGLIPMMFPNYQRVDQPGGARLVRGLLGHASWTTSPATPWSRSCTRRWRPTADPHKVRGMYIMGENPAMSDPDLNHARHALASLRAPGGAGHLHDRDRLAGRRGAAGQRLAREDRHRQQHRPHGAAGPAGARRRRATRGRTCGSSSRSPGAWAWTGTTRASDSRRRPAVYEEMRQAMHGAIARHHLGAAGARVQRHLPLPERGRPGPAHRLHRPLPDRRRPRASWCRPTSSRPTSGRTPTTPSC